MAKSSSTNVLVVILVIVAIVIAFVIGLFLFIRFLEVRRKMSQDARVEAAKSVGNTKRNHRRRFSQTEYDLPRSDTLRTRRFSVDGGDQQDLWGDLLDDVDKLADDKDRPMSELENLQIDSYPTADYIVTPLSSTPILDSGSRREVSVPVSQGKAKSPATDFILTPIPSTPSDSMRRHPTAGGTNHVSEESATTPGRTNEIVADPVVDSVVEPMLSTPMRNIPVSGIATQSAYTPMCSTHHSRDIDHSERELLSSSFETDFDRLRFLPEEDMMIITPADTIIQIVHEPVVVEREYPRSHPISVDDMTEEA